MQHLPITTTIFVLVKENFCTTISVKFQGYPWFHDGMFMTWEISEYPGLKITYDYGFLRFGLGLWENFRVRIRV